MDKQFFYLVSAVLQPMKSLKAKAALLHDFPNEVLYYPSLYGLKPFEQIQSKGKLAFLISFSNEHGILEHLFKHRFLDLQVLGWFFLNSLQYFVKLYVSSINNFLAGIVRIFLENELSLVNNLPSVFHGSCRFPISNILGNSMYYDSVLSLKCFGIAFGDRLLDKKGVVIDWKTFQQFAISFGLSVLNVLNFNDFSDVHNSLLNVWSDCVEVYKDGSLKDASSAKVTCGAVAYFLVVNMSIEIRVFGLLFSTLAELQAIALALEYVPASCDMALYLDSQSVIDAYVSEAFLPMSDFRNQWVLGNVKADELANKVTASSLTLPVGIQEQFLVAENTTVFGNACYFKAGPGYDVILSVMLKEVDWVVTANVWYLDSCMLSEFISRRSANLRIYLIKVVHRWLPVVVRKRLYNKNYPGVLCLLCSKMELLDHVFSCSGNTVFQEEILVEAANKWISLTGFFYSPGSIVLHSLSSCSLDVDLYAVICKGFVLKSWLIEATLVFESKKKAVLALVSFVRYMVELHCTRVWLVRSKHRVNMEKANLTDDDGMVLNLSHCMESLLSDRVATVGSVIAVMKKATKVSSSEGGFKMVASRKKRKGGVLAESVDNSEVADKALGNRSWNSEMSDTTESESIDMEEECLVEETSVDYGENGAFAKGDPDQTPKSLRVKTKKVLGKPLSVIDYGTVDVDNDVLDVSVHKSFALDIDLVAEKLNFVRKIFSGVNGFGRASAPLKFGGIIQTSFTSEKTMMAAAQLANDHGVIVNTDLKRPINNRTNWAIVLKKIPVETSIKAVHVAISEFGLIKLIKIQLVGLWQKAIVELEDQIQANLLAAKWSVLIGKDANARDEFRALLYTLPMGTTTHDLWNFIGLVGGKTCVIEHSSVSYVWAHCATVCFDSEGSLIQAMANTLIIKGIGLHWSCLTAALCSICRNSSHTSLTCCTAGASSSPRSKKALLSIYEKKSAPVSHPLTFGGKTWASVVGKPLPLALFSGSAQSGSISYGKPLSTVSGKLEDHLKNIESSLVSFTGQIGELAKRLDSFVLAVSQPSPGCQLPVTLPSQNQEENIVMGVDLDDATSDKTAAITGSTASLEVVKLKNMLEGFSALVMSLLACLDGLALAGGALPLPLSQ
ncbi:hypothetical protein G9A89_017025 [Geosiphon pyriformis]|nr:hypothetical protein G9A89_017025 [Geosiphon pyriformis]